MKASYPKTGGNEILSGKLTFPDTPNNYFYGGIYESLKNK